MVFPVATGLSTSNSSQQVLVGAWLVGWLVGPDWLVLIGWLAGWFTCATQVIWHSLVLWLLSTRSSHRSTNGRNPLVAWPM